MKKILPTLTVSLTRDELGKHGVVDNRLISSFTGEVDIHIEYMVVQGVLKAQLVDFAPSGRVFTPAMDPLAAINTLGRFSHEKVKEGWEFYAESTLKFALSSKGLNETSEEYWVEINHFREAVGLILRQMPRQESQPAA